MNTLLEQATGARATARGWSTLQRIAAKGRPLRPMAYDEELAGRIRQASEGGPGLTEKRMFGGLAFVVNGNMAVAASGQGGILPRCDPVETESLLGQGVDRFVVRGRGMDGWLHVRPEAVPTGEALSTWVTRGLAYARSLPSKWSSRHFLWSEPSLPVARAVAHGGYGGG